MKTNNGSYDHFCIHRSSPYDMYTIGWSVDYKLDGSRIRNTRTVKRHTDDAGAKRFCEKWGVKVQEKAQRY